MDDPASASPKLRVISIIDGSNLHVSLRARAQPTRLHYTRLSIEVAKRLPPNRRPWTVVRTYYVTSSPIPADNPDGFKDWCVFDDMLRKTDRVEVRLGRREGPPGARREKGVDTLVTVLLLEGALLDTYDVALLFSSDGDFGEAVDAVRAKGKPAVVPARQGLHGLHRSDHVRSRTLQVLQVQVAQPAPRAQSSVRDPR